MKLNQCNLLVDFRFNSVQDSSMTVKILTFDSIEEFSVINDVVKFKKNINLPTKVQIEFFGKNMNLDTVLDNNGNIIADKNVIIENIFLDNIPIPNWCLSKFICLVTTENQKIYTNYIGHNGFVKLDFCHSDVFRQLMSFQRLR